MADWATYFEDVSARESARKGTRAPLNAPRAVPVGHARGAAFGVEEGTFNPVEHIRNLEPSWGLIAVTALVSIWVGTEIGIRALKRTEIDIVR